MIRKKFYVYVNIAGGQKGVQKFTEELTKLEGVTQAGVAKEEVDNKTSIDWANVTDYAIGTLAWIAIIYTGYSIFTNFF